MSYSCVKVMRKECDGCMSCKREKHYYCPVCGSKVYETVYVSNDGEVVGCDNCTQIKEPWEMIDDED